MVTIEIMSTLSFMLSFCLHNIPLNGYYPQPTKLCLVTLRGARLETSNLLISHDLGVIFCKIGSSASHGTSSIWLIFGMSS